MYRHTDTQRGKHEETGKGTEEARETDYDVM